MRHGPADARLGLVTRVLDVEVQVGYGQAYVLSGDTRVPSMDRSFQSQTNGLCGAATTGVLFLITGTHTGPVPFAVDVVAAEPPIGEEWEDVVEVSFTAQPGDVVLMGWAGGSVDSIPLDAGRFRVRYCFRGLDAAREHDSRLDGDPPIDRCLLQFWPSGPRPDSVLRLSSEYAASWHDYARNLPPGQEFGSSAEDARRALLRESLLRHSNEHPEV